MRPDLVLGNPPYQNTKHNSKSDVLWWKFVVESVRVSKIISLVCPPSWLAPGGKLELMRKQNVVRVDLTPGSHFSEIGSQFCTILIDNRKSYSETQFVIHEGVFVADLRSDVIPHDMSSISRNITSKMLREESAVRRSTLVFRFSDEYHSAYKERWVSDLQEFLPFEDLRSSTRIDVFHTHAQTFRTEINHPNNNLVRVCIACSGRTEAILVHSKGITEASGWVVADSVTEGENLVRILNSDLYQFFLNSNKWSGWNLVSTMNLLPRIDWSRSWTDSEIYDHFGISVDEISYIESKKMLISA